GIGIGEFRNVFPSYASDELLEILPRGVHIVNYAHNEFIDLFSETGLTGLGVFLWFLVLSFYYGIKSRPGPLQKAFITGAAAMLIHSFFSVSMRFGVLSIMAFALLGMGMPREEKEFKLPAAFNGAAIAFLAVVFSLLFFWGTRTLRPLADRKLLASEKGFFEKKRKWNEQELRDYIKAQPKDPRAYYRLGWIQAQDRNFEEAVKNFKKTIELDRNHAGAYNNLGNIYYMKSNISAAMKYYKKALKINPRLADSRFNLGYIYYNKGMLEEATKEFEEVLKIQPDNYKARIMLEKMVQ
ncbi:MAG: tetratricopeptide repeat protein, partial [Elusimicrobiota bacterium]